MKMWIYVVRRLLLTIPVIIGVMTITFGLISALPIQYRLISIIGPSRIPWTPQVPCQQLGINQPGDCRNPAYFAAVQRLGLDQPIPVQWARYIYDSLTLNWGHTDPSSRAAHYFGFTNGIGVATVLGYLLPYTLELAALSLVLILVISIPLGNLSAVARNRPVDQATRLMSFSGFAFPTFLLATLSLLAISAVSGAGIHCGGTSDSLDYWIGSWPSTTCFASGRLPPWIGAYQQTSPSGFPTVDALYNHDLALAFDSIRRMLLPAMVIAFGTIAGILRFVRNSMLEVMNLDYIRTARAKGLPEPVVINKHAGRNSLNVTVTILGLTFAGFIGGFPIIEEVFGLRGVGLLLAYSILQPFDYGLIFGTTLLFTIIVVAANIIVDVIYVWLDPRVRLG